jgi:acyl-CoA thioesterase I
MRDTTMAGGDGPLILALGDSLTAGYGLTREQAFPAQLERRLRTTMPDAVVINEGVNGDTTADALRRLPRALARLARRPDLAIVEIGANDLLRGTPPARARADLDAILTELTRCAIPVLMAKFELPTFLGPLTRGYDGIVAEVAARHGAATHPFFPPGVLGGPAFVLADRLHPNAAGIERVADAFLPAVVLALGRSEARVA